MVFFLISCNIIHLPTDRTPFSGKEKLSVFIYNGACYDVNILNALTIK